MNRIKFHVKKGDQVEVISGNFKGSSGKVLEVLPQKQRVLVEGVRMIKKHLRKSQDNPSGKIADHLLHDLRDHEARFLSARARSGALGRDREPIAATIERLDRCRLR